MSSACCVYDFTSFETDHTIIMKWCKKYTKKWCFQQEECPSSGNLHFQGRISLKLKKRLTEICKDNLKFHFTITSKENRENNFYVTKEESRIDGPWSDEDEVVYIPRQVREINCLKKWQDSIIQISKNWDTRSVNVLIDKDGGIGKSTLVSYVRAHRMGRKIPAVNDYKDLMRMVCDIPTSSLYLIDMPRGMSKRGLIGFFSAIEEIKNGYAWDDRYKFTEKIFDCPNIWIFSNALPDKDLLSHDRWKLWEVDCEDNLSSFAPPADWGKKTDSND
jgi:hypothetical protein